MSEELEHRIEAATGTTVPSIDDTGKFQTFLDALKSDHPALFTELAVSIEERIDLPAMGKMEPAGL
jgi:hypothetical protein